jgi:hypothetical protein
VAKGVSRITNRRGGMGRHEWRQSGWLKVRQKNYEAIVADEKGNAGAWHKPGSIKK